jgi:cation:H+ antiporter
MLQNIFILAVSLFLVIKGATLATKYAARLAESFNLSKYVVGFIIISIISILPEAFIGINSAIAGMPAFGLGTLFGSNVSDLTFVFAVIVALAGRGVKIESKILKNNSVYPILLLLPLILGFDGFYSRSEGLVLIIIGLIFYYLAFRNSVRKVAPEIEKKDGWKNLGLLIFSMVILLAGSHYTVTSAAGLAINLGISPILIGMLIVGLGTTMPELFFSLKAVKKRDDSMAVGDILGTVLADATILVGLIALINPFAFPIKIIYVTGAFMVIAAIVLMYFMTTGKFLSKRESRLLFLFWLIFITVEYFVSK